MQISEELFSEPCQTFKMAHFATIVNSFWQGSEYVSVLVWLFSENPTISDIWKQSIRWNID